MSEAHAIILKQSMAICIDVSITLSVWSFYTSNKNTNLHFIKNIQFLCDFCFDNLYFSTTLSLHISFMDLIELGSYVPIVLSV
jgi:hypothetical protein